MSNRSGNSCPFDLGVKAGCFLLFFMAAGTQARADEARPLDEKGTFTLLLENDALNDTDRDYKSFLLYLHKILQFLPACRESLSAHRFTRLTSTRMPIL